MNTNKIELTCRAANDPLILKEAEGKVLFVNVFCLHNRPSASGEHIITMPIILKAGEELAPMLHRTIKRGYKFTVRGKLDYWKNKETNHEIYSILAEKIEDITEPKQQIHSLNEIEL